MPPVCPICGPIPDFNPFDPGAMERHVATEAHRKATQMTASMMATVTPPGGWDPARCCTLVYGEEEPRQCLKLVAQPGDVCWHHRPPSDD